jgi:hypothetical protein
LVPRKNRPASRPLARTCAWVIALALAPSGALAIGVCPLLAEAARPTRVSSVRRPAGRADAGPVATATSGSDDSMDVGQNAATGDPRTTGLIGWPNYAMNCYFVPRGPDHKGRRVLCVDAWEGHGRLGHGRLGGHLMR